MFDDMYKKSNNIFMKFARRPASEACPHRLHLPFAALYFICPLLLAGVLTACGQEAGSNGGIPTKNI